MGGPVQRTGTDVPFIRLHLQFRKERADALSRHTRIQGYFTSNCMLRRDGDQWTGGIAPGVGALFKKGMFLTSYVGDEHGDESGALSIGVQPDVRFSAHWKDGWTTILPSMSLALNWQQIRYYKQYDSQVTVYDVNLSGGFATGYMPVKEEGDFRHGWTASIGFIFDVIGFTSDSAQNELLGVNARFIHFPGYDDYVLIIGAKIMTD